MSDRFTETEIRNLHLLGRMLASTRNFATSPLNKAGRFHLAMLLDSCHKLPAALLNPSAYDVADDVERLKELLDGMNNPNFLQKDSAAADEDKAWTIPELNAFYTLSIRNEESINNSDFCGCFHCISIFPVADVKLSDLIIEKDGHRTAICPICGIDSVLGDASVEISAEILEMMNEYYF